MVILSQILTAIDYISKYEIENNKNIFKKVFIRKNKKKLKESINKINIIDLDLLKEFISIAGGTEYINSIDTISTMSVVDDLYVFKFKKIENEFLFTVNIIINDDLGVVDILKTNKTNKDNDFSERTNFSFGSYLLQTKEDYKNSYKVRINNWICEYIKNYCINLI